MKILADILIDHGFYGPFRADRSCVVDRGNSIVLIVLTAVKGEAARTDIAEAVARAMNAQAIVASGREAA